MKILRLFLCNRYVYIYCLPHRQLVLSSLILVLYTRLCLFHIYCTFHSIYFQSLVYMLKHRKTLTEPEVRYYMSQLVSGVKHIHNCDIVHRDLKLGNMLLNNDMQLKIADFGLATRVDYEGEKKM